jgi:hypothetical protein
MKKEQRIYHPETNQIKRPTEEMALARITREEKQIRHQNNVVQLDHCWWHGKYWINGKPQR